MRIKESGGGQTGGASKARESSSGSCPLTWLRVPERPMRSGVTVFCINPMLLRS
jgi:hypothetical protein